MSTPTWDSSPWYFNSRRGECSGHRRWWRGAKWLSIASYQYQWATHLDTSPDSPLTLSTGTNTWEIILLECQGLKSPICHGTTVLYFTVVPERVSTNNIFLTRQELSQFKHWKLEVSGQSLRLRCPEGVWGVEFSHGFCTFNNFLVFNLISNKLLTAGWTIDLFHFHTSTDRSKTIGLILRLHGLIILSLTSLLPYITLTFMPTDCDITHHTIAILECYIKIINAV